jgi:rhodanese-related sulfurtransferase
MSSDEFHSLLSKGLAADYQIIDVREPHEVEMVSLNGTHNIKNQVIYLPLSKSGEWANPIMTGAMLDPEAPTICICHHGMRSFKMCSFLVQQAEFAHVLNLEGGIHGYATEDPSIGTY